MGFSEMLTKVLDVAASFLPRFIIGSLIFFLFYLFGLVFMKISHFISHKVRLPKDIRVLIGQLIKIIFLLAGAITALGLMGAKLSTMLTALGLTGFALGVALKDILTNLISGLVILINRPFKIKDRIEVLSFSGIVLDINLRYTVIDTEEDKVFLPNHIIFLNPLRVFKANG